MNTMKKIYTIILLITLCLGCLVSVTKPAYAGCSEECKKSKNCSIAACVDCDFCHDGTQCRFDRMKAQYLGNSSTSLCWYCRIVSIMTNAFLSAVAMALVTVQTLGRIILKLGFMIWLALYILKQVSSMAPTSPGKMLQEVLVMGFKVLLANIAIEKGIPVLTFYILDPIMMTGIDYGVSMLNQLISTPA